MMPVRPRTPADARLLLVAAIATTGLSQVAIAAVLSVDARTVRKWLAGDRAIPGPAVQLCRALVHDPGLARALGR